jgi:hypothetical protein
LRRHVGSGDDSRVHVFHEPPAAGLECVRLAASHLVQVETSGLGSRFHILARFIDGQAVDTTARRGRPRGFHSGLTGA